MLQHQGNITDNKPHPHDMTKENKKQSIISLVMAKKKFQTQLLFRLLEQLNRR